MKNLSGLPVNLILRDKVCLLVGAGNVGVFKAETLLSTGAKLLVVSPEINKKFDQIIDKYASNIKIIKKKYHKKFIKNKALVITATNDASVNAKVHEDCVKKGIWVNSADDRDNCEFTLMSLVKKRNFMVAIGTFGQSPAMAKYLRTKLTNELDYKFENLVDILSSIRDGLKARNISTENLDWKPAFEEEIFDLLKLEEVDKVKKILTKRIEDQL